MKKVTKRNFCHNVTTYLKEGEDLVITGRNFYAVLNFGKKTIVKKDIKPERVNQAASEIVKKSGFKHADNCPCYLCKPPKK